MAKLQALIVDDEPLAREGVREMLAHELDVEICGECSDGVQAVEAIERLKPDILFLDVQMPEVDGFDVVEAIEPGQLPAVVFVTAYDEYALRAFDVHAVDYLLKPLDQKRFRRALDRVRETLSQRREGEVGKNVLTLLRDVKSRRGYVQRFVVRSLGRLLIVNSTDVDWVEAEGDYACLHLREKKHLIRETMNDLEHQLDPEKFLRIHRSTIVNIDRVKELYPHSHGEYTVVLKDGTRLTSSRTYRDNLDRAFRSTL